MIILGQLFFQSDIEDVAIYMRDSFEIYGKDAFQVSKLHETDCMNLDMKSSWKEFPWLKDNPTGVPTERETMSLKQGVNISRMLLVRK